MFKNTSLLWIFNTRKEKLQIGIIIKTAFMVILCNFAISGQLFQPVKGLLNHRQGLNYSGCRHVKQGLLILSCQGMRYQGKMIQTKELNVARFLLVIILLTCKSFLSGQIVADRESGMVYPAEARMRDSVAATKIPVLTLPDQYRNRSLPAVVDNSQLIYWPGIQDQHMFFSCQQYSGVAYVFGFEINRLRDQHGWYWENSYSSHYTWNFMNSGIQVQGVSFLQSFEVIRQQGHMTSRDYGVETLHSTVSWPSGYEKYYNGMFNRLKNVSAIQVNSAEGINTLRNYLFDHLDGSSTGGIGCFSTSSSVLYNMPVFPPGTPEEGMNLVTGWYAEPSHGLTIVGYNDSVRFDINQDGQFTNDIDITGDGIVDACDWEFGAFKIANSYGNWWSNLGYTYAMYRSFAMTYDNGGVWNNSVFVLDADTGYRPLLTAKIDLTYNLRKRIRIRAGVSLDTLHNLPEQVIDFPIFNFQGGDHYMQGIDTIPEHKNIEIGLDITPLLNLVPQNAAARYFILIEERDPEHIGTGSINHVTFINYRDGIASYPAGPVNQPVTDNGVTAVSAVAVMKKSPVTIVTAELPPVSASQPYQVQLEARGGTEPYKWQCDRPWSVQAVTKPMPAITGNSIWQYYQFRTFEPVALPFKFPFYETLYDTLYVNHYGFVAFAPWFLPGLYVTEELNMLRSFTLIAPAFSQNYTYQANKNDGIWFYADADHAVIRWKVSVEGYVTTTVDDFALILYPDGHFEFCYGTIDNQNVLQTTYCGVSRGDGFQYNLHTQWNANELSGKSYTYRPAPLPNGLTLTPGGLLTVDHPDTLQVLDLQVTVSDACNITATKTLMLSRDLSIVHQLKSGENDRYHYGEPANLQLEIRNTGATPIQNLSLRLSPSDSLSTITDADYQIDLIDAGASVTVPAAFSFHLTNPQPDGQPALFRILASSGERTWEKSLTCTIAAHTMVIGQTSVNDGTDNRLEPGEVAELVIPLENSGSLACNNMDLTISCSDSLITFRSPSTFHIDRMDQDTRHYYTTLIKASRNADYGHLSKIQVNLTNHDDLNLSRADDLVVGLIPVAIADLSRKADSRMAMAEALDSLAVSYDTLREIPFDYDRYQSIFLILGTYQTSHTLTSYEASTLVPYLMKNGNLYMEGYNTWHNIDNTTLHPWFRYSSESAPVYFLPEVNGVAGTFTDSLSFANNSTNNFAFYNFTPLPPAITMLANADDPPKSLGIAYDGVDYRTIGTLTEFGALTGNNDHSTRKMLMKKYLDFFGIRTDGLHALFHADQTSICNDNEVGFTDDSFDGVQFRNWEFPGGVPSGSDDPNPVVVYPVSGTYDVMLTVSDGTITRTLLKKAYIKVQHCAGLKPSLSGRTFTIYPNPAHNRITLVPLTELSGIVTFEVYNAQGVLVKAIESEWNKDTRSFEMNLDALRSGCYLVKIVSEHSTSVNRVIIL